ncbi:hypothetical protein BBJ28_00002073 [Nothophytophthora sp. Chile5]|nr:hypothetical protein BBJ28_00002073 [Nothophytophthora sp. Chile5]
MGSIANSGYSSIGHFTSEVLELTHLHLVLLLKQNVILKAFDFGMQLMVLRQLLENGSPVVLTMGFAAFLAANSLSCAVSIVLVTHSALAEVVVDLMFDLIAAVVYPILVLLYYYLTFAFDRQVYLTYLETLPVGAFERLARMFADPSEIALFRVSFDSLRIESFLDFVLRIGLNLSFCYRFKRVMDVRALIRRQTCLFLREHGRKPCKSPRTQQKAVPKAIARALFAFSVAVLVYTHQAIVSSEQTCSVYPECVVHAYRFGSSSDVCQCIILIDVDRTPMTYDQWIHPVDACDKVKTLAAPGMLKSLQLINRQLLEWPEELRACRHLKTTDLVGKQGGQNLLNLPEDLFIAMPRLAWLHIGVHNQLTKVPPLSGVPNLRIRVLAWMFALKEVPSFEYVPNLQSLFMIYLPILERLPDMSPLRSLVGFGIAGSSHICCNGFRGVCDLIDTFCVANLPNGIPGAICLEDKTDPNRAITPFLGNADTERVFEAFAPAICQKTPADSVVYSNIPTKETIEMCSGKPFRQCYLSDGSTGICFNTRMQVLSCFANEDYIALRRLQIQKEVGLPCDPEEEKWLGCSE